VPADPPALFPPPIWTAPFDPVAALPPPPIATGTEAAVPPEARLGLLLGPADCSVPAEPEASFPPPTCAAPVELLAELPNPPIPIGIRSVELCPLRAAFADGAVSIPLDWAVPVELEALLPPPT
jgi:hypothetical protein